MVNGPEMRVNISLGLRGNKCGLGNKSRTGQKIPKEEIEKRVATYCARGYCPSEEAREKRSIAMMGHLVSDETRQKIGMASKGRRHSEETKAYFSKIRKGHIVTGKTKAKIAEGHRGKVRSEVTRQKIRETLLARRDILIENGKKAWECPDKVEIMMANMLKARRQKPNNLESGVITLLERHFPNEWKYVGNGGLVVGGKCPDFARNHGHNQLLEIYGDYWHRGEDPQDRIGFFRGFGYGTLVIWESQLKSMSESEFVGMVALFMEYRNKMIGGAR